MKLQGMVILCALAMGGTLQANAQEASATWIELQETAYEQRTACFSSPSLDRAACAAMVAAFSRALEAASHDEGRQVRILNSMLSYYARDAVDLRKAGKIDVALQLLGVGQDHLRAHLENDQHVHIIYENVDFETELIRTQWLSGKEKDAEALIADIRFVMGGIDKAAAEEECDLVYAEDRAYAASNSMEFERNLASKMTEMLAESKTTGIDSVREKRLQDLRDEARLRETRWKNLVSNLKEIDGPSCERWPPAFK